MKQVSLRAGNPPSPPVADTRLSGMRLIRPLSMNGPKNNDKKMKWPVEAIGILVLQDVLLEVEWDAHLMHFSSIRL